MFYVGFCQFTGNFNLDAISCNNETLAGITKFSFPDNAEELTDQITNQKYYYLSRGHQVFAFISEDGRYVLKFFNFSRLEPSIWSFIHPSSYKKRVAKERLHRIERLFLGHEIAASSQLENYGLLYTHLQPSKGYFFTPITVVDRIGLSHTIPLNEVFFVVQKKGAVVREMFTKLLSTGDVEGVKKRIDQLFALYLAEYEQRIFDKDPNVIDNVAFTEERAIRIDVGRLKRDPVLSRKELLDQKLCQRLSVWLQKYFPGNYAELKEHMEEYLINLDEL